MATKSPATKKPAKRAKPTLELNLALQGGGSHGAFTWGVLDRLLEEEDITITGISGTSAGAMNAAVLIDGYHEGGRARAKEQLHEFWREISAIASAFAPFGQSPVGDGAGKIAGMEWLSSLNPMEMFSRSFSPYDLNPMNYNPLRTVLERVLTVENLHNGIALFVAATNVETGEARIFQGKEISIDVLLASACLPLMYQAVEIDGVPYWDGGYMGNPAIWPLIYKTGCEDVLLVQINPIKRSGTPMYAMDILDRVNEISFNSSLIAEMRAIHFVQKLIHAGKLSDHEYSDMRIHRVLPPEALHEMGAASKMNADWNFLLLLHGLGRRQMDVWLKKHKKSLGKSSTLDIEQHFLASAKPKNQR